MIFTMLWFTTLNNGEKQNNINRPTNSRVRQQEKVRQVVHSAHTHTQTHAYLQTSRPYTQYGYAMQTQYVIRIFRDTGHCRAILISMFLSFCCRVQHILTVFFSQFTFQSNSFIFLLFTRSLLLALLSIFSSFFHLNQ